MIRNHLKYIEYLLFPLVQTGAQVLLKWNVAEVCVDIKQFKNVVAIRDSESSKVWGFHSLNMELFELTPEIWQTFSNLNKDLGAEEKAETINSELFTEIQNWESDVSSETQDALDSHNIKTLSLNVVQICNLKCTYCAAGGDGTYGSNVKKLDLEVAYQQIRHFINQYEKEAATEKFSIHFLGGEPLLHAAIVKKLCQYAILCSAGRDVDLGFSITTNGTLITEKVAQMLAEFNFNVAISLDGDANINDKVRPAKGTGKTSTEQTLAGIKNLLPQREKLMGLQINSVFGPHNLDVASTYQFLMKIDSGWSALNFLYANNDPALDDANTLEYISQMRQVATLAYKANGLSGLAQVKQFQSVLARIAAQTRIQSYCGAGKSLIQADTRGELYSCNWFMNDEEEKMGSKTNVNPEQLEAYKPSLIELNNCQTCWARHFCGGGCMFVHKSKTGDKHSKDPNFCKRTRSLGATAIHFYGDHLIQNEIENKPK